MAAAEAEIVAILTCRLEAGRAYVPAHVRTAPIAHRMHRLSAFLQDRRRFLREDLRGDVGGG